LRGNRIDRFAVDEAPRLIEVSPMRKRVLLVFLLAAPALGACAVQETGVSAYTSDEQSLEARCTTVADTGDMYRYCMQFGPQQALAAEHR
jgi:hypothetical protein